MTHKSTIEKVPTESPDLTTDRLDALRGLIPEAFTEGKVDFDKLRAALGDVVDGQPERYSFSWAGKRDAIRLLQTPSSATLVPAPEESVNWDTTQHLFIEGDNLEVLKLLYKAYFGKVKLIYIDPPYNTGNDFVYPDDFADPLGRYLEITGQKDAAGNLLTSNPETSGRYHSAWLSMLYSRLTLARQLLRADGVICISIGEEELYNLRAIMNEIFGEENYRNTIIVRRYDKNLSRQFMDRGLTSLAIGVEYVVIYSKTNEFSMNPVFREASKERQEFGYWKGFWNAANRPTMRYELLGVTPTEGQWKWESKVAREAVANYEEFIRHHASKMSLEEYWNTTGKTMRFIRRNKNGQGKNLGVEHWIPPSDGILRTSNWNDILASGTLSSLGLQFSNPKNPELLQLILQLCSDEDSIILDFFAGSATIGEAVYALNSKEESRRHFILVQLPEPINDGDFSTIAEVGKERLRRVIARNHKKRESQVDDDTDNGFRVFKLAPSNFHSWMGTSGVNPIDYVQQMSLLTDFNNEDWQPEHVVWEMAVKEGFPLTSQLRVLSIQGHTVYRVIDPADSRNFHVCLDDAIRPSLASVLELTISDLFICRDSALDDTGAANLALHCRLKTF